MRYSVGIVNLTRGDTELLNRKIRKTLTRNVLFYLHVNVTRLYLKIYKAGGGLLSVKDCSLSG